MAIEKFCTRCGKKFLAVGREVICPSCKQAAAEEAKKAAVLKAKRASWNGESVPVRISGRASTVIRKYGEANSLSFAESLDALLKATSFFEKLGVEWSTIQPYKSRRRDKHATEDEQEVKPQEAPQDATAGKQDEPVKPVKQAAKKAVKTTSKAAGKAAGKATSKK